MSTLIVAAVLIWGLPIAAAGAVWGAAMMSHSARAVVVRHLLGERDGDGRHVQPGKLTITPRDCPKASAQRDLEDAR